MKRLIIVLTLFFVSAQLSGKQEFPQGVDSVTTYWPNGQIKEHYHVALHYERVEGDTNKVKIGLYEAWYDNGQLAEQNDYNFGECEGWQTTWYPNGQMKEKGYCFWRRQGLWLAWFESGALAELVSRPSNILHK